MPIKRSLAEKFIRKRNEDEELEHHEHHLNTIGTAGVQNVSATTGEERKTENLTTKIENVRKVGGGYLFDITIVEKNLSIRDVFMPAKSIYSSENLEIKEQLEKIRERKRKIGAYFMIYPAAIVSFVIIMDGAIRLINYLKATFNLTGFNF
jgi:phosphoribosyl-dephospho-CoA transferase